MNYKKLIKYLPWAPAAYWASTKIALPAITKAKSVPLINKIGGKVTSSPVGKAGSVLSTVATLEVADEVIGFARKAPIIKTLTNKAIRLAAVPKEIVTSALLTTIDPTGHVGKFVTSVRSNVNPLVNSLAAKAGLENIADWANEADEYGIQLAKYLTPHDNTPVPKI